METHGPMVKEVPERTLMVIRKTTTIREIGALLDAVQAYVDGHGGQRRGPPLAIYYSEDFNPESTELAAGFPVAAPLPDGDSPAGRVSALRLPAGRVACVTFIGPYAELSAAYTRLHTYVTAEQLQIVGPPREWYLTMPQALPAPATEVQFPVR